MTLFSTFQSLEDKNNSNGLKAATATIVLTFSIYAISSIPSLFIYGSNIHNNLIINIGEEKSSFTSILLRIEYIIVIGCHIPYFFFATKESMLIIIDEFMNRSISKSLQQRLYEDNYEDKSTSDS